MFGHDENGLYKELPDGRVLRIREQIYNTILTLSRSVADQTWDHGW